MSNRTILSIWLQSVIVGSLISGLVIHPHLEEYFLLSLFLCLMSGITSLPALFVFLIITSAKEEPPIKLYYSYVAFISLVVMGLIGFPFLPAVGSFYVIATIMIYQIRRIGKRYTSIRFETKINAPIHKVFDLSRDIDLHQISFQSFEEEAIAGITTGLIQENETVTWRGKHFGFTVVHESIITSMKAPYSFVDEMKSGKFKKYRHSHIFKSDGYSTIMIDQINYRFPFGIWGQLFDRLVFRGYFISIINQRNFIIQSKAESK